MVNTTQGGVQTGFQASIEGVPGFKAAGVHCGLRNRGKLDLAMIAAETDCNAAGIFTTNQVASAHVHYDRAQLANNAGRIRAVVINSKIANVCTGEQGARDTARIAAIAAEELGCEADQVLVMSTGIIGPLLPMHKVERGVRAAAQSLADTSSAWHETAMAIMTTDTRLKLASRQVNGYTVAGVAKGSGMIAPNMATMLATIVTDAVVPAPILQEKLKQAADASFNRITVDGDTSTSDTVLMLANGHSGKPIARGAEMEAFEAALLEVCQSLAKAIVYDGEGATKFIAIEVSGAADDEAAWRIGNTIANSPLVKTAFAGSDANWGRIMAAAGRAGVPFDQNKADLWFDYGGDGVTDEALQVFAQGQPTNYAEAYAADIFAAHDISVHLRLGEGTGRTTVWTCDLSHDYVSINADYRT
ncbi:MAG: bifunctional glutamate N-acetyltransferase/amino-acid acetyltransferase ArgJ [Anaerolineales bacterium]